MTKAPERLSFAGVEFEADNGGQPDLNDTQRAAAALALQRWADFPVAAELRPVVLLGGAILCPGFTTGEAKGAYMMGRVDAAASVPDEPIRHLAQVRQLQPIDAVSPLWVLGAIQGTTEFSTDRGSMQLPAWRVEAVDALESIWVLSDEGRRRCWSSPSEPDGGWPFFGSPVWAARVDHDGLGLSVDFTGGIRSVFRYQLVVIEADTAVVVVPVTMPWPSDRERRGFVPARGDAHHGSVRLRRPLGSRVVVNPDASPVSVTGAEEPV